MRRVISRMPSATNQVLSSHFISLQRSPPMSKAPFTQTLRWFGRRVTFTSLARVAAGKTREGGSLTKMVTWAWVWVHL